jgi:hypothetical protein
MITKQQALEQLERYRVKIFNQFPYLIVEGTSISSQSFCLPKHPENDWNKIVYHIHVSDKDNQTIMYYEIMENSGEYFGDKSEPMVYCKYTKSEGSREMTINGMCPEKDDIFNHLKPVDKQLIDIAKILIKRKVV